METKRKSWKLIFVLTSLHAVIGLLAGMFGWMNQMLIVINTGVLVIWIIHRRFKSYIPVLICLAPFYLFCTTCTIILRSEATYPIWIWGALSCFITWHMLRKGKRLLLVCTLVIMEAVGYFFVMPNNFAWVYTEDNPEAYRFDSVDIADESGRSIDLNSLKGRVVLFDVWNTGCGSCIRQFKDLQKFYGKYRNDSAVRIFSLNMPLKNEDGPEPSTYTKKYSFGKLYFRTRREAKKLPITGVPLILIMDKEMKCRYAGDLNTEWNVFIANANTIINKLKKEL